MASAGVSFVSVPRTELCGRVAVFLDVSGNRWDLLGPAVAGCLAPQQARRGCAQVACP
ncbi:hypothetical protein ACOBQX_07930 [Actinokineospora sp. G85]|uniref:hypothetical protein n=1 Tax=Actinokineospora sp. G85 TaxID=3406626 RepID=UPI003C70928F